MRLIFSVIILTILSNSISAQNQSDDIEFSEIGNNLWMGSYNQFRVSEKFYWMAELHYRRTDHNNIPFAGRMSQIYNRHAINYFFSKNFNVSFGGVLRLDFTPDPGNPEFEHVITEPRIWHEYLFVMPFPRFRVYHRIRLEHRWTKSMTVNANDWIFRNRWRYKFFMKIPLNKKTLSPGTFYLNPEVEIIMQSGKSVRSSPLEDLRIAPLLSYIVNSKVTYSTGLMYTMGQNLGNGLQYRQRFIYHFKAYISLDFRKDVKKIPTVNTSD